MKCGFMGRAEGMRVLSTLVGFEFGVLRVPPRRLHAARWHVGELPLVAQRARLGATADDRPLTTHLSTEYAKTHHPAHVPF
jgi:hypothetical protein